MKYLFYLFLFLYSATLLAQTPATDTPAVHVKPAVKKPQEVTTAPVQPAPDSTIAQQQPTDSFRVITDTVAQPNMPFKASRRMLTYKAVVAINPFFNCFAEPLNLVTQEHHAVAKDALFYIFAGLLFFFALIKLVFSKYVDNLMGLVFRGSLRQKQIREQLLQTPLPSLFLNIFFVIVAGLYIFFLLQHYQTLQHTGFWLLLGYCVTAIGLVYLVKFIILKFTGWIFNMRDAADTYIFIVFLVNKLLAIFLLPLLIVLTFSMSSWTNVLLTLSYVMVIIFFTYRYIVSFAPVRREVKVSQFHFFMYLCAFEIIPLLLIYKVLMAFF